MSHPQMNNREKYQFFIPRKLCFWHSSGKMHWVSMGSSLTIFFSINNLRRFHIQSAQRRRAKQQFSKTSKWKLLTPAEIENHLIPYNLNSKGDNLRQVDFWIEFAAVWWWWVSTRQFWSEECHLPCTKRVLVGTTDFELRTITPLLMTVCVLQSKTFDTMTETF